MNERNDLMAHADQRAERLIALGADRGIAREIAASELGLIAGDRIELDGQEGRGSDLSLRAAEEPRGSLALGAPREKAMRPNILTMLSPDVDG